MRFTPLMFRQLARFLGIAVLLVSTNAFAARIHVLVLDGYYSPAEVTVGVGDTVVWEARHGGHTVTASDRTFDSSHGTTPAVTLPLGARYSHTFTEVGVYPYFSRPDGSRMNGTITVQEPVTRVVTNANDSGPGSMRQAILELSEEYGPKLIRFNIPGSGVHTIVLKSILPSLPGHLTIDGYSQPGSAPNTDPLGMNAVVSVAIDGRQIPYVYTSGGLSLASNSAVRGVAVYGFYDAGISLSGGGTVEGCFVGTDPTGTSAIPNGLGVRGRGPPTDQIGGTSPSARNLISGNTGAAIEGHDETVIEGNFVGTDVTGRHPLPNGSGVELSSYFGRIGGLTKGSGNVISGNVRGGVFLADGSSNQVVRNYIGVDVTGTAAVPNGGAGIFLNATGRFGGVNELRGNVISGNDAGIGGTSCSNVIIEGNLIGTDATGREPIPNEGFGITLYLPQSNRIGGETRSAANVIAFNKRSGIWLDQPRAANPILGNSIFGNGTDPFDIGIDAGSQGITPNDPLDADTGYADVQNRPTFSSVSFADGQATVNGRLHSTPNTTCRLEFFTTRKSASTRGNEGQISLGAISIITDASGNAQFTQVWQVPPGEQTITATATSSASGTSEFGGLGDHLLNISTRGRVETGEEVLIGGFIVAGESKRIIIRAIGPSLVDEGVSGVLADPTLELFHGGTSIAFNDNWKSEQAATAATGIPPVRDAESALVRTLAPGTYTAVVRGKSSTTGVALVEVFDLDETDARLANISTRGHVGTGGNVLIGGFIVAGETGREARVIVRGLGPSLAADGVSGTLEDPTLTVYNADAMKIAENDNWRAGQQSELQASGIPPSAETEAAAVLSAQPGSYTAVLAGKDNGTGVGLIEIYDVP